MVLWRAIPLLGALEGVGPGNLDFFGPKWHSLRLLQFQGPKKVSIFIAQSLQWPLFWVLPASKSLRPAP